MATHTNFYETLKEAQDRLCRTMVMYEDEPVYVWTIGNHKADGVFRIYISPIDKIHDSGLSGSPVQQLPGGHQSLPSLLDEWMTANPNAPIRRKMMNSPKFNKFRPFPLGMCNAGENAYYIERQPARPKMEQGLIANAVYETIVSAGKTSKQKMYHVDMYSKQFRDCVLGKYPTPNEVLSGLTSTEYVNESVAFHRYFALVRGPIGTMFLAHKEDVVGLLPNADFSQVKLAKDFGHLKEAIEDLSLFEYIKI